MDKMLYYMLDFCNTYPHMTEKAIDTVSYAIGRYGFNTDHEYWRDKIRNANDKRMFDMPIPFSEFYGIVDKPLNMDVDCKKVRGRGLAKLFRSTIFTDPNLMCIDDSVLLKLFLDEINERGRIQTSYNTMTCSDYLWYISYEGRLGRVKWGGSKCNAEKMLKKGWIKKDKYGIYRADRVLDRCGCEHPRHRPILKSLSRGKWSSMVMEKLTDLLDGGHDMDFVIDENFADAYEPTYDENLYIDDLVTSQSCMSCRPDDAESFYGNIEGCHVMRFLKDGKNVGRCIMYEYEGIRHFIRIYCKPEYQRDCLYTLRKQLKEGDLFGRDESIHGIKLKCNFDDSTNSMYLDGGDYGLAVEDGKIYMVDDDYNYDGKSTYEGSLEYVLEDYNIHRCYSCGDWVTGRCAIHDDEEERWYCCESCAEEDGFVQCDYCGDWCRPHVDIDSHHYCSSSCAREDGYVRCHDTDDWISEDDAFFVDDYAYSSEEGARKDGWEKCVECGEWVRMDRRCEDNKPRCWSCLRDGWELVYVRKKENNDETKDETSGD